MIKPHFEINRNERPGWRRVLANQAKEFCLSTGLHGYKYIAQANRSVLERSMWAIGVTISLCCAVVLMYIAWEYNASHPTLTVIESTHHGIWNYWFPAVTICDLNRVSLNRTQELVSVLRTVNNETEEELVAEMQLLNELLDPGIFGRDVSSNLSRLQELFAINNLTIPLVMQLVTRNCSEMIVRCKWKGDIKPCDSLFESALARDGLCCSFNYAGVASRETASICQNSDSKRCPKNGRGPRRVTACGYQTGLTALINPAIEDYHASVLGAYGVKVMLHDPYNYPDRNAGNKLIGIGTEVFVSVTPVVIYSTEDVRSLPISKRNCIFSDEWIHLAARTCNLRDVECIYSYRDYYETSWPGENITSENLPPRITSESFKRPCGCMPDCDMLQYPLESSAGIFDRNNSYHDLQFYENVSVTNHSVLHVFFSDLVSTQYRRDMYYNWHNLFASFGGLLGLFAGFSLMSGFELIYFFSIRLIADLCTGRGQM